ncbi:MAG: formylglycine-generating enzyme family protein [Acidobacteria bacterium]|nr:formylglycine-generating enzyme family protein [Acidobacteriota bacterium]
MAPLLFLLAHVPASSQGRDRDHPSKNTSSPTTSTGSTGTGRRTGGTGSGRGSGTGRRGGEGRRTTGGSAGPTRTRNPLPATQPYEFSTLKLGAKGEVVEQAKQEGMSFSVDLGGVTMEMVKVPQGAFYMGTPEADLRQVVLEYQKYCDDPACREAAERQVGSARPQHLVTVPAVFFIGKFEVTQAQWLAVSKMQRVKRALLPQPSKFRGDDRRPVEQVSWDDAVEFCARLSRLTGLKYRLPSEAEWEYACRAGTITQFAFGDTVVSDFVNFDGTKPFGGAASGVFSAATRPVGWGRGGIANAFGLYDMHGNVAEWCQDTWVDGYANAPEDARPRAGGSKVEHVVRGGSWKDPAARCRSAAREKWPSDSRQNTIGFRVVVS